MGLSKHRMVPSSKLIYHPLTNSSYITLINPSWLVVWIFFQYMGCHPSNWRTHVFQRGRYTTNQLVMDIYSNFANYFWHHPVMLDSFAARLKRLDDQMLEAQKEHQPGPQCVPGPWRKNIEKQNIIKQDVSIIFHMFLLVKTDTCSWFHGNI